MSKLPSISELARTHKVSRSTLTVWRDQGLDLTDTAALAARIAHKRGGKADEDAAAARLRKLRAEADLAELKAAQLRGEVISIREVEEAMTQIGSAVRASIIRLEADLPPMLEGLDASAIKKLFARRFTRSSRRSQLRETRYGIDSPTIFDTSPELSMDSLPDQINIAELATYYKVSTRTIRRWSAAGIDLSNPLEIARHLICQRCANVQSLEAILAELDETNQFFTPNTESLSQ